jgi:DNA-directed RNA polymerase subunit L
VGVFFDVHDVKHSDIHIQVNTSPLHNEFISQRISLIPLHFSEEEIASYEKLRYKFVIDITNTSYEMISVTSDDIQIIDTNTDKPVSKAMRDRVFPRDRFTKDPIVITKLKPNMETPSQGGSLQCEFYASKGTKEKHTCYCPVSLSTYYNVIDKKAADEAFKTYEGSRISFDTLEAQRFFYKNGFDEPTRFQFEVETECAIMPKHLVSTAFDRLVKKLLSLKEGLDTANPEVVQVHFSNDGKKQEDLINVTIFKETHTIGNLLQCLLYNYHIREKKAKELTYVGYNCPHPLQQVCLLRLAFSGKKTDRQVASFLSVSIDRMMQMVQKYKAEWDKLKL